MGGAYYNSLTLTCDTYGKVANSTYSCDISPMMMYDVIRLISTIVLAKNDPYKVPLSAHKIRKHLEKVMLRDEPKAWFIVCS